MKEISTRKKGQLAEDAAAQYLEQNGFAVITRNYTVRGGELDIVATDEHNIIFVEVKSRKNQLFGKACEAVDKNKISHLVCAAERFLFENRGKYGISEKAVRFDVIEIYTQNGSICHIKNIDIN